MSALAPRAWAGAAAAAAALAAGLTLGVVRVAQRHYERAFAFRIARTTAAYIATVTPPPLPPPPPPAPPSRRRGRRVPRPVQPAPSPSPAAPPPPARSYDLPSLLTQAHALETLPGWSSNVEVYFGTAPLIAATAAPLSPEDVSSLPATGGRWRDGSALVPLYDRDGQDVVGAVAVRPRSMPHGPLPGGFGFSFPAALIAMAAAGVMAFRQHSLRRGGYIGAALLLAVASYVDVRGAARQSTDRWLFDTRRLLQEAAKRLPPSRARNPIPELAGIVRDGQIVTGEPGESPARRVRVDGESRAVVAVLVGPQRWLELRSTPAEIEAPRWLIGLLPTALLGPFAIMGLRWAERTSVRRRREAAIAWGFLGPATVHLLIFTAGPALYAFYLASLASFPTLVRDPLTWKAFLNSATYALYVPVSIGLALSAAVATHRYRAHWSGRVVRAAFLLPYVASVVAVALLWQAIYHAGSLGLDRPDWLSNPRTALAALMLVSLWVHVGGQMLVFLSGLQSIPQACLDAARIDGASSWQVLRRVTLPMLRSVTWLVALTGILGALQMFTLVAVLTQGGPLPPHATDVAVHRIYGTAVGAQAWGTASALALILALILVLFRWPQLRVVRREVPGA